MRWKKEVFGVSTYKMKQTERMRVLITARTYPTPAKKGVEVSCTAGISEGRWIRLFPVPYRFMDYDKRFSKYQWVELDVTKASDPRPESYVPNIDSVMIISRVDSKGDNWQRRKDIIYPLRSHCLCCLKADRDKNKYPTLGIFRPRAIHRLVIEPDEQEWTPEQLARLRQLPLFNVTPAKELEKIPYRFQYEFECDHTTCPGHTLTCTDWELAQSHRSWLEKYGSEEWEPKFRQKFEQEMIEKNDTHFYVGTMHGHPGTWIIVGLFYPRKV